MLWIDVVFDFSDFSVTKTFDFVHTHSQSTQTIFNYREVTFDFKLLFNQIYVPGVVVVWRQCLWQVAPGHKKR